MHEAVGTIPSNSSYRIPNRNSIKKITQQNPSQKINRSLWIPRRLQRKPRMQWKKDRFLNQGRRKGRGQGQKIREPWRRVIRWTNSVAKRENQIRKASSVPYKQSGSTRRARKKKKKPFFAIGSVTLRKPRFDPTCYPDRKLERQKSLQLDWRRDFNSLSYR